MLRNVLALCEHPTYKKKLAGASKQAQVAYSSIRIRHHRYPILMNSRTFSVIISRLSYAHACTLLSQHSEGMLLGTRSLCRHYLMSASTKLFGILTKISQVKGTAHALPILIC